jgi:Cysteine rich repeat
MARRLTLTILLLLLVSMPPASGQYVTVIEACTRDVKKFCHAAQPKRNFIAECIEAHFQDFHEQCRAALVRTAAVREACKVDIEQQCPTARPGAGRILLCVKKHFAALDQSCKDAIGHAAELKVGSY